MYGIIALSIVGLSMLGVVKGSLRLLGCLLLLSLVPRGLRLTSALRVLGRLLVLVLSSSVLCGCGCRVVSKLGRLGLMLSLVNLISMRFLSLRKVLPMCDRLTVYRCRWDWDLRCIMRCDYGSKFRLMMVGVS